MTRPWTVMLASLLSLGLASAALAQDAAPGPSGNTSAPAAPEASSRPTLAAFSIFPPPTIWVDQFEPAPGPAPQRPRGLAPLYVSLISMQALDLYTTAVGVRGGAVERNAIVGAFGTNGAGGVALKAASVAGTIYAAERLWKHHPARAIALIAAVNCALAVVAANNLSVISRR
ncbi:MAG TPA: hypothetical protein VND92_01190 [Vicinamibacterales bacterium]|nr:hypothetical protein [Vicinamibacterales bacterium]